MVRNSLPLVVPKQSRSPAVFLAVIALAAALILALISLQACNTLQGAGQDLQNAGQGLQQLTTGNATLGDKDPNPYSR